MSYRHAKAIRSDVLIDPELHEPRAERVVEARNVEAQKSVDERSRQNANARTGRPGADPGSRASACVHGLEGSRVREQDALNVPALAQGQRLSELEVRVDLSAISIEGVG